MIAYTKMTPKWQILEGKLEAVMTPLVKGRNFFNDDEVQELFPDHEDGKFMFLELITNLTSRSLI